MDSSISHAQLYLKVDTSRIELFNSDSHRVTYQLSPITSNSSFDSLEGMLIFNEDKWLLEHTESTDDGEPVDIQKMFALLEGGLQPQEKYLGKSELFFIREHLSGIKVDPAQLHKDYRIGISQVSETDSGHYFIQLKDNHDNLFNATLIEDSIIPEIDIRLPSKTEEGSVNAINLFLEKVTADCEHVSFATCLYEASTNQWQYLVKSKTLYKRQLDPMESQEPMPSPDQKKGNSHIEGLSYAAAAIATSAILAIDATIAVICYYFIKYSCEDRRQARAQSQSDRQQNSGRTENRDLDGETSEPEVRQKPQRVSRGKKTDNTLPPIMEESIGLQLQVVPLRINTASNTGLPVLKLKLSPDADKTETVLQKGASGDDSTFTTNQ